MDLAKLAGFDSVRMTAQWTGGVTTLPPGQMQRLQRAAMLASMRGIGKVTLAVNGATVETRYAAPYVFSWEPKRKGRYVLSVRAADASGNVGSASATVDASRARRADAASPSRWVFRRALR